MTEQEWLQVSNPTKMLQFLQCHREVNGRKMGLFACACVRCIESLLRDKRSKKAVEVAEQYADGRATEIELETARTAAQEALNAARAWISRIWSGVRGKSGARAAEIEAARAAWVTTYADYGSVVLDWVYWAAISASRAQGTKEDEST